MKPTKALFLFLVALALTACSSDPQWADPEAHEKTEQLRKQYTPIIAGTWHVEYVKDKGRFFERLTFSADGTFTGMRKWQTRKLVTIDGEEQYTDWQNAGQPTGWGDEEGPMNGTFTGTWQLKDIGTQRAKAARNETVCNWKQSTTKSENTWPTHTSPHSTMPMTQPCVFKAIMPRTKTVW